MRDVTITMDLAEELGPMRINRISLGQGGLSLDPMWENRVPEIKALNPSLLRFWVQEYFNPIPEAGVYDFVEIYRQLEMVRRTGAVPLVCLNFKPRHIWPEVNDRIVMPENTALWDDLIFQFVCGLVNRGMAGLFFEVIGESDMGEGGGCPFLATAENYPPFYALTAAAILRADPSAKVGGPGLANSHSDILPAFTAYCEEHDVPLHFVSWHIYTNDPVSVRGTIEHVQSILNRHPKLHAMTILDEWSILWDDAADKPDSFLPCFIADTAWHMIDAGLDYSCYYQIRDYHVDINHFSGFFTAAGAAFMTRWWNRMPQWGGLFDYQDTIRPAYFAFKLLSRLTGNRLELESDDPSVHGFLTYDPVFKLYNLMFWNFSADSVAIELRVRTLPVAVRVIPFGLDVDHPSNDENHRIKQGPITRLTPGDHTIKLVCQPYGIHFQYLFADDWYLES